MLDIQRHGVAAWGVVRLLGEFRLLGDLDYLITALKIYFTPETFGFWNVIPFESPGQHVGISLSPLNRLALHPF